MGQWSSRDTSEIDLAPGKLTVRHARDGQARRPATAALPRSTGEVMVTRRAGLLTIAADGEVVYSGCPGPVPIGKLYRLVPWACAALQGKVCVPRKTHRSARPVDRLDAASLTGDSCPSASRSDHGSRQYTTYPVSGWGSPHLRNTR